jgi:RNA polymerase-associated protein LEO1
MSSSDEDVVRRPGRTTAADRAESPVGSEHSNTPAARDLSPFGSDAENMNGDDDADLFGSDGSEGGFGNEEKYKNCYNASRVQTC